MANIRVYAKPVDPYSTRLVEFLRRKKLSPRVIYVEDDDPDVYEEFVNATGQMELPALLINGKYVGDYEEVTSLDLRGKFDELVEEN